jgi:hypothetical protein
MQTPATCLDPSCASLGVAASSMPAPTAHRAAPESLAHEWRLVDGKYWQVASPVAGESADVTDAAEGTRGGCTAGMVEIEGQMMVGGPGYFDVVEALQKRGLQARPRGMRH